MTALSEMMVRYAQAGRVETILLRHTRREPLSAVDQVNILEDGLEGDHSRAGKRAVTLIQSEHLPVIASLVGQSRVAPILLRRNIVVSGLNLAAFRGKHLCLGEAVVELTVPCHPCSRMEDALGEGGYTAMRGHGGMCAAVVKPGVLTIKDAVRPIEEI